MASFARLRIAGDDGGRPAMCLSDLPNELCYKSGAVAHRFQNLIIRVLHARLPQVAALKDRQLILECYHPSAQYTEPYLHCDYLGTPGLSGHTTGQGFIYEIVNGDGSEGTLRKLYSRFRPTRNDPQHTIYRSHPAGDIPGSRTSDHAAARHSMQTEVVSQNVNLEAHELFAQLRFLVSLVQIGPRRGFFVSIQNIVEKKTTRIFRTWLAEMAQKAKEAETGLSKNSPGGPMGENNSILWVDQNKVAGLKVGVKEPKWRRDMPVLLHKDEDQAISYILELQELLISTTHLMLAVERSLHETEQDSGKAMIFGSFATANPQQTPVNAVG